jgi:hypothetical protein
LLGWIAVVFIFCMKCCHSKPKLWQSRLFRIDVLEIREARHATNDWKLFRAAGAFERAFENVRSVLRLNSGREIGVASGTR